MADLQNVLLIEQMADEFAEAKVSDINKLKRKQCMKCKWSGCLTGDSKNASNIYCNWAELNDKQFRDCLPWNCKYFEKGRRSRKPVRHISISKGGER